MRSRDHSLTARQREVFEFLVAYQRENGYPPSFKEVMAKFGMTSTNAVSVHLKAMEAKGYITRRKGRARAISFLVG